MYESSGNLTPSKSRQPDPAGNFNADAIAELERRVLAALQTYSNVHRGSGYHSTVTTHLFDEARNVILDALGLDGSERVVIFCSPWSAKRLLAQLGEPTPPCITSQQLGLPIGVVAVAVRRQALKRIEPVYVGGGAARLVSPRAVAWARLPDRFEAGTPAVVPIITLAATLRLMHRLGEKSPDETPFKAVEPKAATVDEVLYRDELESYSGIALLEQLRAAQIGRAVCVPTTEGPKTFVNLDNAASTPTFIPVWDVVRRVWRQTGASQQPIIDEVKSICARVLGAPRSDYDIVFTANATEAINIAVESFGRESQAQWEPVVLSSLLEHSSNDLPWRRLVGVSLVRLPADPEGFFDLQALERLLSAYNQAGKHGSKRIRIVALSGASNVLGAHNPLAPISAIVHRYGARLLVDGAQMVAHRTVDIQGCGIDYFAFSGHKAYAPFGSGALIVRKGQLGFAADEVAAIQASGEQNVAGIAALGKALQLLERIGMDRIQEQEQTLTAAALRGLSHIGGVKIFGVQDPGSPRFAHKGGVIVFSLKGSMPNRLAEALALRGGIGVRYGCHCAHMLIKHLLHVGPGLQRFQHVIVTLFPKLNLPGLTRISFGLENTQADVDRLIEVVQSIAQKDAPARSLAEVKRQVTERLAAAAADVYSAT